MGKSGVQTKSHMFHYCLSFNSMHIGREIAGKNVLAQIQVNCYSFYGMSKIIVRIIWKI